MLQSITIGSDNFMYASTFKIDNLINLQNIVIGMNSFTTIKSANDWDYNKVKNDCTRSFYILNCIELESIEIGSYSFVAFGDKFELINLPKLSTIKIGEIGNGWSLNFYFSSFVIKGIIIYTDNE